MRAGASSATCPGRRARCGAPLPSPYTHGRVEAKRYVAANLVRDVYPELKRADSAFGDLVAEVAPNLPFKLICVPGYPPRVRKSNVDHCITVVDCCPKLGCCVRSSAASRQTQPWAAAVPSSPSPLPSREEFESARQNLKLSLGETEVREQAGGDPAESGVQPPVALAAKQQRQPLQLRTSPEYEAFRERELRRAAAAAAAAAAATAAATASSTTAGGTST